MSRYTQDGHLIKGPGLGDGVVAVGPAELEKAWLEGMYAACRVPCVCGHLRHEHWFESDPDHCCEGSACKTCNECLIFHTEPSDPKEVEALMLASGFVRTEGGDWKPGP